MRAKKTTSAMRAIAYALISCISLLNAAPPRAWAMLVPAEIPNTVQTRGTRIDDVRTVQAALESKSVRVRLKQMGYTDQEIQTKLNKLSDKDVHQLASRIHALNPAGEGEFIGILVVVLLVLLIIYLVRRV